MSWAVVTKDYSGPDAPKRGNLDALKTRVGSMGQSSGVRMIQVFSEDKSDMLVLPMAKGAKVSDVKEMVAGMLNIKEDVFNLSLRVGASTKILRIFDEAPTSSVALGLKKFNRRVRQYEHPVVVIGGGLGALQCMVNLLERGREDFICIEKHTDFGGHSWMQISNGWTKLQTEKGTYHLDFLKPEVGPVPDIIQNGVYYGTWPTRDLLLYMFRQGAKDYGLYEKSMLGTAVVKVKLRGSAIAASTGGFFKMPTTEANRTYCVQTLSVTDEDAPGETVLASACLCWPGNLHHPREITWPGEEEFGGYIDYGSINNCDYHHVTQKEVLLFGHGAFMIENVRTCLEHNSKKIWILCRKRNLTGMKIGSWFVTQSTMPVPAHIMLKCFQMMYDLVGFDVWTAHSVTTDPGHTRARIVQKTIFGVNDVYFLACHFGLAEVVIEEIKRISHQCVHTKNGRKIPCEVVLKVIGTEPDPTFDKVMLIKDALGIWLNSDPLLPCVVNPEGVSASNFGGFSAGPMFATFAYIVNWFIDYPEDFEVIAPFLPQRTKTATMEIPLYCLRSEYMLPTMAALGQLPSLQAQIDMSDGMKSWKQRACHPLEEYVVECQGEWEMYIKMFKDRGSIPQDTVEPPYPYTIETVRALVDEAESAAMAKYAQAGLK